MWTWLTKFVKLLLGSKCAQTFTLVYVPTKQLLPVRIWLMYVFIAAGSSMWHPTPVLLYTSNPIVIATLKIWAQIRRYFKWYTLPQSTPTCNNQLFPPARIDQRFMSLPREGLIFLKDLFVDGSFASFAQLWALFGLANSDCFLDIFKWGILQGLADHILLANTTTEGHVSFLYHLLVPTDESTIEKIKVDWANELLVTLSDQFWSKALENIKLSSSCIQLNLIQFKVLHRVHYSRSKLSKIYPDMVKDKCNRC